MHRVIQVVLFVSVSPPYEIFACPYHNPQCSCKAPVFAAAARDADTDPMGLLNRNREVHRATLFQGACSVDDNALSFPGSYSVSGFVQNLNAARGYLDLRRNSWWDCITARVYSERGRGWTDVQADDLEGILSPESGDLLIREIYDTNEAVGGAGKQMWIILWRQCVCKPPFAYNTDE